MGKGQTVGSGLSRLAAPCFGGDEDLACQGELGLMWWALGGLGLDGSSVARLGLAGTQAPVCPSARRSWHVLSDAGCWKGPGFCWNGESRSWVCT